MRNLQTEKVILLTVVVLIAGLFIGRTFLPYTGKVVSTQTVVNETIGYMPGELIIKFNSDEVVQLPGGRDEASIKDVKINKKYITDLNKKYKVIKVKKFANKSDDKTDVFKRIYKFKLSDNIDIEAVALEYAKDASVNYTMPNYYWFLAQTPYPNDTYYRQGYQWALYRSKMNAKPAWDAEKGNSSQIIIGIVDSGIDYNHPELADNYIGGYDYESETGGDDVDPMDRLGHGTAVAGIIAASTNNYIGMAGGCPECKLYVVKVGSSPEWDIIGGSLEQWGGFPGTMEDGARGIVNAVNYGAKIISVSAGWICRKWSIDSWGSWKYGCDPIEDAVAYANSRGVLVVAAAGNTDIDIIRELGINKLKYLQPATEPGVLTVAATDYSDNMASFSYYGRYVEVAAPGEGIFTTDIEGAAGFDNTSYNYGFYGTSAATPHVSALAGLLWSKRPDLNKDDITKIITMSVDNVNSYYYIGSGRVNYARAMGFLDYNVLKGAPDYNHVIQRCCVESLQSIASWTHNVDTTSYIQTSGPTGNTCVNWDNYCSEWDSYALPKQDQICNHYQIRILPSEKVYFLRIWPLAIKDTLEGLSIKTNITSSPYSPSVNSIQYTLNKPGTYQWDLSCCTGTIDNDKDGFYTDDTCPNARDCNDNYVYIQPGRNEYCGNSVDDNCNGYVDEVGCTLDSLFPLPSGGGSGGGAKPFYQE